MLKGGDLLIRLLLHKNSDFAFVPISHSIKEMLIGGSTLLFNWGLKASIWDSDLSPQKGVWILLTRVSDVLLTLTLEFFTMALKSLTTLRLCSILVSGDYIRYFLFASPLLQSLSISFSTVADLKVSGPPDLKLST
jgi:hypothetical protein